MNREKPERARFAIPRIVKNPKSGVKRMTPEGVVMLSSKWRFELESVFRAPSPPQLEFKQLDEPGNEYWDDLELLPGPPDGEFGYETIPSPMI